MRVFNQQHRFYAGVDLHARSMFTHVVDPRGRTGEPGRVSARTSARRRF